ncbi:PilZ domain-containing protein [Patescibacteria group bacterium]|nr:PilZ domain-containing protein [Patescibacteria group bacterium]
MENNHYKGPERRNYARIVYKPSQRPVIQIQSHCFEVADVSKKGVRFVNDREIKLDNWIRGTLVFLCGESVAIEGSVEWQKDDEFGVRLSHPIPTEKIEYEQRHILLNCD